MTEIKKKQTIPIIYPSIGIAFMLAVGLLVYSNSFHAAMVFDDKNFIIDDTAIHMREFSWEGIKKTALEGFPAHRYLPNISFAVNYYFGGLDPFGYHVVNLAIHLLTGVFLFFLVTNTLRIYPNGRAGVDPRPHREGVKPTRKREGVKHSPKVHPEIIAFFTALIWIVQPVGTQAVTYICQRMASMVALFYVLSLLLYIKGRMAMTGGHKALPYAGYRALIENAGEYNNIDDTPNPCKGGVYPRPENHPGKFLVPILCFAGSALAALCAIATKENAGTLPIIILLYEWFFFQGLKFKWSHSQILWALFFILIFGGAVIWYMGGNPMIRLMNSYNIRDFNMMERVLTQFRIIIYYISLFLYAPPGRLNLDHNYPLSASLISPPTTFVCMIAIFALIALSAAIAKKERIFAFCIFWFFITQATESTVIGIELIFEHRTYIPFMMTSLMLVLFLFRVFYLCRGGIYPRPEREGIKTSPTMANTYGIYPSPVDHPVGAGFTPARKPGTTAKTYGVYALFCAIVLIFSFWTYQRNQTWIEPIAFWKDCIQKSPAKWRPNYNLAKTLYDASDIKGAIAQYEKTIHLHPDNVEALNNLSNALMEQGRLDEAIRHLRHILNIAPRSIEANVNLGNALVKKGDINQAIHQYQIAMELNPKQKEIYMNLGKVFLDNQQYNEAVEQFDQALALEPEMSDARIDLGNALAHSGRPSDAIYHYETVIQKKQNAGLAARNRDTVLAALPQAERVNALFKAAVRFAGEKNYDKAVSLFQGILAITPNNPLIYYNISCLYAIQDRKVEAVDWLRQAVEKGYGNWKKLKIDPDLDNIRNEAGYQSLIKETEKKATQP